MRVVQSVPAFWCGVALVPLVDNCAVNRIWLAVRCNPCIVQERTPAPHRILRLDHLPSGLSSHPLSPTPNTVRSLTNSQWKLFNVSANFLNMKSPCFYICFVFFPDPVRLFGMRSDHNCFCVRLFNSCPSSYCDFGMRLQLLDSLKF